MPVFHHLIHTLLYIFYRALLRVAYNIFQRFWASLEIPNVYVHIIDVYCRPTCIVRSYSCSTQVHIAESELTDGLAKLWLHYPLIPFFHAESRLFTVDIPRAYFPSISHDSET